MTDDIVHLRKSFSRKFIPIICQPGTGSHRLGKGLAILYGLKFYRFDFDKRPLFFTPKINATVSKFGFASCPEPEFVYHAHSECSKDLRVLLSSCVSRPIVLIREIEHSILSCVNKGCLAEESRAFLHGIGKERAIDLLISEWAAWNGAFLNDWLRLFREEMNPMVFCYQDVIGDLKQVMQVVAEENRAHFEPTKDIDRIVEYLDNDPTISNVTPTSWVGPDDLTEGHRERIQTIRMAYGIADLDLESQSLLRRAAIGA